MKYVVCGEVKNMQYNSLLKFAINYSDLFSVSTFKVHKKDLEVTYFDFFQNMAPFEVDKYECVLSQHYERGQKIHVFRLSDIGKQYLTQCHSFWEWSLPKLPEDISFYKNKKAWMNCITHERMILIESNDQKLLCFLDSIGLTLRNI